MGIHTGDSGVVLGKGQLRVPTKTVEKLSEILDTCVDVLFRIEGVFQSHGPGCPGHELHQALGADT